MDLIEVLNNKARNKVMITLYLDKLDSPNFISIHYHKKVRQIKFKGATRYAIVFPANSVAGRAKGYTTHLSSRAAAKRADILQNRSGDYFEIIDNQGNRFDKVFSEDGLTLVKKPHYIAEPVSCDIV